MKCDHPQQTFLCETKSRGLTKLPIYDASCSRRPSRHQGVCVSAGPSYCRLYIKYILGWQWALVSGPRSQSGYSLHVTKLTMMEYTDFSSEIREIKDSFACEISLKAKGQVHFRHRHVELLFKTIPL